MRRTYRLPSSVLGWTFLVAVSLLFALMTYALFTYALAREVGSDVAAYLGAAERLRAGEPFYVAGVANASDLYRYAPWFAYAWIPLSYLPSEAVTAAWVGLMIAAAAVSTLPLVRHGFAGLAAAALFAPIQLQAAVFGNVQPLLVLMLMWGVERRSGPLWIAVGASLKAVPLVLALVYAGRGEWLRAGLAGLLTGVLVAPAFLFNLSDYPTQAGPGQMSLTAVAGPLFLAVAIVLAGGTFIAGRAQSRYAWLVGAGAMMAALPRLLTYEIGFLLVGFARRPRD